MTIKEAIDMVDLTKSNVCTQEEKIGWLSDLDSLVMLEIIQTHADAPETDFTGYDADTDVDTQLLVLSPYTDIYKYYLESKIDLANGEIAKYNNSNAMFSNAYMTFAAYYNRAHMPLQAATHFTY